MSSARSTFAWHATKNPRSIRASPYGKHQPTSPGAQVNPTARAQRPRHTNTGSPSRSDVRCGRAPLAEICRNTNTDSRFCRAQNTHSGTAMAATLRSRLDAISDPAR